jgi:hypothetical protein
MGYQGNFDGEPASQSLSDQGFQPLTDLADQLPFIMKWVVTAL